MDDHAVVGLQAADVSASGYQGNMYSSEVKFSGISTECKRERNRTNNNRMTASTDTLPEGKHTPKSSLVVHMYVEKDVMYSYCYKNNMLRQQQKCLASLPLVSLANTVSLPYQSITCRFYVYHHFSYPAINTPVLPHNSIHNLSIGTIMHLSVTIIN